MQSIVESIPVSVGVVGATRSIRRHSTAAHPALIPALIIAVVATGRTSDGRSSTSAPPGATADARDAVDRAPLVGVRLADDGGGVVRVRSSERDLELTEVDGSLSVVDHDGGPASDLELLDGVEVPIAADGSDQTFDDIVAAIEGEPDGADQLTRLSTDPPEVDRLGRSWRVEARRSLFDNDPGEDTTSFTIEDYPPSTVTLADLSPDDVAGAEETYPEGKEISPSHRQLLSTLCRQAGAAFELTESGTYEFAVDAGTEAVIAVDNVAGADCDADSALVIDILGPDGDSVRPGHSPALTNECGRSRPRAWRLDQGGTYQLRVESDGHRVGRGDSATGTYRLTIRPAR